MIDKPNGEVSEWGLRDGPERSAYRFLAGRFVFFGFIASRVFTGIASMRRAISSRGICGSSVCRFGGRALFMVGA